MIANHEAPTRVGWVGASRVKDIMAKGRGGSEAVTRKNYKAELVAMRLTGERVDTYTSHSMMWGIEKEPDAKRAFEFLKDVVVQDTPFIPHPDIEWAGASPDGLVGEDELIEIKCPNTATHIDYILSGTAPTEYAKQMQWQLACTKRKRCHFVSYDPRMPIEHQVFTVAVDRDNKLIAEITIAVKKFLVEIDEVIAQLKTLS